MSTINSFLCIRFHGYSDVYTLSHMIVSCLPWPFVHHPLSDLPKLCPKIITRFRGGNTGTREDYVVYASQKDP